MNDNNKTESYHFKCGGLLGAILELNLQCGMDIEELKAKDERWWTQLHAYEVSRSPSF